MRDWVHFSGAAQPWHSFALWLSSIAAPLTILDMEAFSKQFTHVTYSPLHHFSGVSLQRTSSFFTPLPSSTFISLFYYLLSISPETRLREGWAMLWMKEAFTWSAQLERVQLMTLSLRTFLLSPRSHKKTSVWNHNAGFLFLKQLQKSPVELISHASHSALFILLFPEADVPLSR